MIKLKRPQGATVAQEKINKRLLVIYLFIIVLFVILVGRLFFMQVVKGQEYVSRSDSNIYRTITLPARRGTIYDRNGNVLASSQPYMSVQVYPNEVEDLDALADQLAKLFSSDEVFEAEQSARKNIAQSSLSETIANVSKQVQEQKKEAEREAAEKEKEQAEEAKNGGGTADTSALTPTEKARLGEAAAAVKQKSASSSAETEEEENTSAETEEDDINAAIGSLTANTKISKKEVLEILETGIGSYNAITVRTYTYEVGVTIAEIVAENPDLYPGVYVSEEPMRSYPNGYYLGHVLGTVGKITDTQLEKMTSYGYKISDIVGQSGLESYYEHYTEGGKVFSLSGQDGHRVVEVDAKNNIIDVISEEAPVAGNSLELTIDLNTQMHMEDSLKRVIAGAGNPKAIGGSAALIDVDTGGVVAMASAPSVDPNDFARGLSSEEIDYYFHEKLKPQMNRAITAGYPSGSTFKMVTATAILKAGVSPNDTIVCSEGSWALPLAKCHWHGGVNFYNAVAASCNIYFQKMAARIGEEALISVGLQYGFGKKSGIDLPSEVTGLLPTPEWKAQNNTGWEKQWHIYDTYYMSMGQGATVDTVIQLASCAATIANHGVRLRPYVCQSILDDEGNVLKTREPEVVDTIELDDADWDTITEAMRGVVSDGSGTARNLFGSLSGTLMPAGKTGTAQTGLAGDNLESDNHGVFIGFAPADNPQVAFACLVEYGGAGAKSAAYVCRDTFRAYFGYDVESNIILMDDLFVSSSQRDSDEDDEEDDEDSEEEAADVNRYDLLSEDE